MRRMLALARAEVLHVTRDRATLAQIFVMPIVQLLVLSNAATFEVRDTSAYIVDHDRTAGRREAWSIGSPRPDTSASSSARGRPLARSVRCSAARPPWS